MNLGELKSILAVGLVGISIGCSRASDGFKPDSSPAQQSTGGGTNTTLPTTTPNAGRPTTPGGTNGSGGSANSWYFNTGAPAYLSVDGVSYGNVTVAQDFLTRVVNSVRNFQLSLSVSDYDQDGAYEGTLLIGYTEESGTGQSVTKIATFTSGSNRQSRYNRWYTIGGKSVYQGFYQDANGGVLIVIDDQDDNGYLSGTVYYRNHRWDQCTVVGPAQPGVCGALPANTMCWDITNTRSPYDCRDFLVNNVMTMGQYLTPSRYKRLGSFSGMSKTLGFRTN